MRVLEAEVVSEVILSVCYVFMTVTGIAKTFRIDQLIWTDLLTIALWAVL